MKYTFEAEDPDNRDDLKEIIHDECGLDVELCVCPDAPYYWDHENGCIRQRKKT